MPHVDATCTFSNRGAIIAFLTSCFEDAVNSPDLARIEAVHEIIAKERFRDYPCLIRTIESDPVSFILEAAPGFEAAIKRITGFSRDALAEALP